MKHYRIKRALLSPIVNAFWHMKVLDKHKFFVGKAVYIVNHLSIMDVNPLCSRLFENEINFVVKEDSIKGIVGRFLLAMGGIPIRRGENDIKAVKACLKVLKENKPLIIFPEGTRNIGNPKELLPFKDGPAVFALKTKSPVVPITYYRKPDLRHRNFLIVGDAIDLSDLYHLPLKESRSIATARLEIEMAKLRIKLDNIVETKGGLRAHLKEVKQEKKAQLLLKAPIKEN